MFFTNKMKIKQACERGGAPCLVLKLSYNVKMPNRRDYKSRKERHTKMKINETKTKHSNPSKGPIRCFVFEN